MLVNLSEKDLQQLEVLKVSTLDEESKNLISKISGEAKDVEVVEDFISRCKTHKNFLKIFGLVLPIFTSLITGTEDLGKPMPKEDLEEVLDQSSGRMKAFIAESLVLMIKSKR